MEEEEKMVERRLEEVQGKGENILGRRTNLVGQITGWKELKDSCKQMVREVAGMCEMARGKGGAVEGGHQHRGGEEEHHPHDGRGQ